MPFTFSNWSLVLSLLSLEAAPPCRTLLMKMPRSAEPEPFALWVVLPLTDTPSPAFSVSWTGMSKVKISRCFQGNTRLSSLDLSCTCKLLVVYD